MAREDQTARATAMLREATGNLDVTETLRELESEMLSAANNLEFEKAALIRDQIGELKRITGSPDAGAGVSKSVYPKARRRKGGFKGG